MAGEILLEVNQEAVSDPADAVKKIKALKDAGKKTALLIVANGQGDTHFVALPLE
jgi:serine protease Do